MKHLNIRVTGRVQGVYFRASTRDIATKLKLRGFVRNEPDGSVYIEAEGSEEALDEFVAWCHHGPPAAIVKNVEVQEGPIQNMKPFDIKR
ncbi:MAG: acylphosphatase [Bacteroidota bacterium]|jgi:acylphosphatase|nr:MAG: acylphosphatase [Bacteroidota bacterium]